MKTSLKILVVFVALTLLWRPLFVFATDTPEDSYLPTATTQDAFGPSDKEGSTFIANKSYNLTSIDIKCSSGNPSHTAVVDIYNTSSGLPTGSSLGTSSTINITNNDNGQVYNLTFSPSISLTSGTKYAYVVTDTGAANIRCVYSNVSVPTGVQWIYWTGSAWQTLTAGYGTYFQTYGTTGGTKSLFFGS